MRIKEVCKLTGLTDKAIRLYINNQLINPCYTENYAGRKNYSFDERDVEMLKKISILRRYNFSISNIKAMINDRECIHNILEEHLNTAEQDFEESSIILTNLHNAYNNSADSLDALCSVLNENIEPSHFDILQAIHSIWKKFKSKIPLIIIICISCFIISILLLIFITIMLSKLFTLLA